MFRLGGLLLLLVALPAARGQFAAVPQVVSVDIKHVGPPAAADKMIRSNIRVKPGDPYRPGSTDDDVRNLYATGLFYNIRVTGETATNGIALTFILQGKPRLASIKFRGNKKYSDNRLRKKLTSKVGEPLDEQKLFTDSREIQKKYQSAGRPATTVKYVLDIDKEAGRGSVTFDIVESPKIKIEDVEFVGAQALPVKVGFFEKLMHPTRKGLKSLITTRRHWMFSWLTGHGVFKEEEFEDDRLLLAEYYRSKGYIDFEIKDIQFEHPETNKLVIRFILYEGGQYKVGSVQFDGNKIFSTNEMAAAMRAAQPQGAFIRKEKIGPNGLKMDVGDVFTAKGLRDDQQQVQDFYGARGYLDAGSARNLQVERVPNTETGTMDLVFKIEEGQKNYVEKIDIRGNNVTRDRVIRRELSLSPGDVFDLVRVRQSRQILEGMQYFSKVDARPEATDVPNRKNLVIDVEEGQTGRVNFGVGFSSVDELLGYVEATQANFDLFNPPYFRGGGQRLRLKAQLGTQRQDYEVQFVEPWFLQRRLVMDLNFYYRESSYMSLNDLYTQEDLGTRLEFRRNLPRPDLLRRISPSGQLIGGLGYGFDRIGIFFEGDPHRDESTGKVVYGEMEDIPYALVSEEGHSTVSKFFGSLTYDSRGPGILPDKGQRTTFQADLAGPFGGEKEFFKLELKTHWFFKGLFRGNVLELIGEAGVADTYSAGHTVPFYDRYYLGGIDSLRAFEYRSISPRQADADDFHSDEPIGGNSYWYGSVEYSVPVIEKVRFAAFYDVGNVAEEAYAFGKENFNDNWGIGLRLHLPIGDLRLDYGWPIHHDKYNSGSGRFQFSGGAWRW